MNSCQVVVSGNTVTVNVDEPNPHALSGLRYSLLEDTRAYVDRGTGPG